MNPIHSSRFSEAVPTAADAARAAAGPGLRATDAPVLREGTTTGDPVDATAVPPPANTTLP